MEDPARGISTSVGIAVPLLTGSATFVYLLTTVDADLAAFEWVIVVAWSLLVSALVLATTVDALGLVDTSITRARRSSFASVVVMAATPILLLVSLIGWLAIGDDLWMFGWWGCLLIVAVLGASVGLATLSQARWQRTAEGNPADMG